MNRFSSPALLLIALIMASACSAGGADPEPSTTEAPATTAAASTTLGASTTIAASTTAGGGAATTSVGVSDFAFSPSTVTISVGDSVAWNLTDGTHTTTSGTAPDGDGLWSETLDPNAPFTFTFEEAGEYPYFCRFHPDFMTGMVIVEP
jgi:plastocyanin